MLRSGVYEAVWTVHALQRARKRLRDKRRWKRGKIVLPQRIQISETNCTAYDDDQHPDTYKVTWNNGLCWLTLVIKPINKREIAVVTVLDIYAFR